jgi:hypothetical protein
MWVNKNLPSTTLTRYPSPIRTPFLLFLFSPSLLSPPKPPSTYSPTLSLFHSTLPNSSYPPLHNDLCSALKIYRSPGPPLGFALAHLHTSLGPCCPRHPPPIDHQCCCCLCCRHTAPQVTQGWTTRSVHQHFANGRFMCVIDEA